MPITRKLVAQDSSEDNQILKVDSLKRYVVNNSQEWQFIFGPNSDFTRSAQVAKIAAEFNVNSMDSIRFTGYLYNTSTGSVDSASTCEFFVHKITEPDWQETLVSSFYGTITPNSYFFAEKDLSDLAVIDFDGGETVMVEAVIKRLSETYRDRVYINHLGIYDNLFRAKKEIEFLDLTKVDE